MLPVVSGINSRVLHQQTSNKQQYIYVSFARAVVKALKSSHITPILLVHWLKITECIEYKLISR